MPLLRPTRRELFKIAAAMPALTLPLAARADLGKPAMDNPTRFSFSLGDAQMTILSDGYLELPVGGLGVNVEPVEVQNFLSSYFLSPETNYSHTNHLLVEIGEAKVLVDVGSGDRFLPTAGRLLANLDAAGIDPATITHVVITHAHPDHIWGIRDEFDEAIFPDAQYFIGQDEHAYWMQDGLASQVPTEMQQFVVGAQNSINVEGADWTLLADGQEVVPGLRVIATPGHTPGHLSVVIESAGQQFMALGDSMNHAYMNFAKPDWYNGFDMDGAQTVATRRRLLDMAAADRIAVLGYHFPFPGVGYISRSGDAFHYAAAS